MTLLLPDVNAIGSVNANGVALAAAQDPWTARDVAPEAEAGRGHPSLPRENAVEAEREIQKGNAAGTETGRGERLHCSGRITNMKSFWRLHKCVPTVSHSKAYIGVRHQVLWFNGIVCLLLCTVTL